MEYRTVHHIIPFLPFKVSLLSTNILLSTLSKPTPYMPLQLRLIQVQAHLKQWVYYIKEF